MPIPVKIIVSGGFGVGKTTAVAAVTEIPVLSTEAAITEVSAEYRRSTTGGGTSEAEAKPGGIREAKTQTTVALDFGRITFDREVRAYLFGTPGQDRFGFMWRDLIEGAYGALVMVDTRRLDECYPAVDYFERTGLPFVVAINRFDGRVDHDIADVRWALAIGHRVPVVTFDARVRRSVRDALVVLLRHASDDRIPRFAEDAGRQTRGSGRGALAEVTVAQTPDAG